MSGERESETSVAPTTTLEQNLHSASQRRVNLIWEYTQSTIAIAITIVFLWMSSRGVQLITLSEAFFLIVGFYFGRTNHQRVGGIKAPYTGR